MSATDYSPANGHSRGFDGAVTPPQNLEAEQSVLGAVLLSDTALPALIIDERLQAADFYRESHGLIFTAMLDLHGAGEPVDALTLVEHLKQAGQLDAVGGRATVDLLAGSVPAVGNVRQYARIVRENAMLRRLLNAAYEIQAKVHSHEALPRELVDLAERTILEVAHEDSRKDFRSIEVVLDAETTKLAELSRAGKAITGTAVGLRGPGHDHGRLPARQPDHPGRAALDGQVPGRARRSSTTRPTGDQRRIDDLVGQRSSTATTRSWPPWARTCGCIPPRSAAGLRSGVQRTYRADDAARPPPGRDGQPPAVHARGLARDCASSPRATGSPSRGGRSSAPPACGPSACAPDARRRWSCSTRPRRAFMVLDMTWDSCRVGSSRWASRRPTTSPSRATTTSSPTTSSCTTAR